MKAAKKFFGKRRKFSLNAFSGQNNNKSTENSTLSHIQDEKRKTQNGKRKSSFYSFYSNFLCAFRFSSMPSSAEYLTYNRHSRTKRQHIDYIIYATMCVRVVKCSFLILFSLHTYLLRFSLLFIFCCLAFAKNTRLLCFLLLFQFLLLRSGLSCSLQNSLRMNYVSGHAWGSTWRERK